MNELLKEFEHATVRDYKGGKEVRTKNLDDALSKARKIIASKNLNIEIFEISSQLRSFSIREKAS